MKYGIEHALKIISPNAQYSLIGDDYENIYWIDENEYRPSINEINDKIDELHGEEPMRLLRIERTRLLAEVDWEVIKAISRGEQISTELSTYMQELRDLPDNSNPSLDSNYNLDMTSVNWPIKP
jgi:hypothetical protein